MKGFVKLKEAIKATQSSIQEELPHAKELLGKAAASTTKFGKHAGTTLNEKYNQAIDATYKAATSEEVQEYYSKTKEVAQKTSSMAVRGISVTAEKASNLFHNAVTQENIQKVIDNSKEIVLDGKNLITLRKEDIEQETGSSEEEKIKKVISKLQKKDKVGLAGDGMAIAGGAAAGAAAAGTIAAAAGATNIFGLTTLGSLLGTTFVAATPVGWVIGSAAAAAGVGYGISKLVRSGSKHDQIRSEIVERLNQLISESQADRMINLINTDRLDPELALKRIKSMKFSIEITQV